MSMFTRMLASAAAIVLSVTLIPVDVFAADARNFNPGRIIDDSVFTDTNTMSISQIQQFLDNKMPNCDTYGTGGGSYTNRAWIEGNLHISPPYRCVRDYRENPDTGANNYGTWNNPAGSLSSAELIYRYAKQFNINPQVLIATLQKENSLVTDYIPIPRQYQQAMGYGCPDNVKPGEPACDPAYNSFSNQLYQAARHFRGYMNNSPGWYYLPTGWNDIMWNPDQPRCGTSPVYIENRATAALYTYTPYRPNQDSLNAQYGTTSNSCFAYGNRNFYLYFTDWFGSTYAGGQTLTSRATNTLSSGQKLASGEFLTSPAGRFTLIMDPSGVLSLYKSRQAIWQSSNTSWANRGAYLRLEDSGNLVLYSQENASIWSSGTSGSGATRLSLQDDGNLVLYKTDGTPVWSSGTNQSFTQTTLLGDSRSQTQRIHTGEYLRSSDWRYFLHMQTDGNLVLYTSGYVYPIWASHTSGKGGKYVVMQTDGNLVMYGDSGAVWASDTSSPRTVGAVLTMQSDGNLVMYADTKRAVWATGTSGSMDASVRVCSNTRNATDTTNRRIEMEEVLCSPSGNYRLKMQTDGNLVMYGKHGAIWASHTSGKGGKYVVMQTDGNLVMYGDSGAVWNSNTFDKSVLSVNVQDDGNLVMYGKKRQPQWSSSTFGRFFKSDLRLY